MDKHLIDKINGAVADMNLRVEFINRKGEHRYQLKENGDWLQGVSSVSSIVPKDWLSAWGAKECAKFLGYTDYPDSPEDIQKACDMQNSFRDMTFDEYLAVLKEAKGAAFRKSKDALVDGKAGHKWLEEYVGAMIAENVIPKVPEGMLKRPLEQFLEWEAQNVDYWILSETIVNHKEQRYCGTLDAVAMMKTGRLALVDFKFASHISEDYYLQTAGYAACFEPYGIEIQDRIIIRLPKTLRREEYNKDTHKYFMVDNNLEVEIVKTPYEVDKHTFFHALPVKAWCNRFKEHK
jgi:hypothetical protein